ncbi:MAG: choice-of-anchor L domain-containing protein [Chloroflexota bacterium]
MSIWFFTTKTSTAQLPPGPFVVYSGGIYTPEYLVQSVLVGQGVQVMNVTYTGNSTTKAQLGYFTGESNVGLYSGVILSSGKVNDVDNPPSSNASTDINGAQVVSDEDLETVGERCNDYGREPSDDASILEFDFIPQSTQVEFRYVFASEEYREWVGSQYNDAFGFFISGPGISSFGVYSNDARNIALIPGTNEEVCINSVNHLTNTQYYNDNTGTSFTYDGYTDVFIAKSPVVPCQIYHIKLAICDLSDGTLDSGVFLEANSFSSVGVATSVAYTHAAVDTAVEACNDARVGFALSGKTLGNMTIHYTIAGTAQNGIDYEFIPDSVIVQSLDSIAFIDIVPISDGVPEDYESVDFIYNTSLCDPPVWDTTTVWIKDNFPLYNSDSDDPAIYCSQSQVIYVGANMGQMPYTYTWTPTGDTTDIITVRPDTTTTYSYSVTDVCGHNVSGDVIVTVLPPEATIVNQEISLCLGNSTTLDVQGGNFWKWIASPFDPTLLGDTLQFPTVAPTDTTIYTVYVSDSCGNSDTASVTVYVGDIVASITTLTPVICTGQSAFLEANFVQDAIYEWYDANGTYLGGSTTCEVYPASTMTYHVIITDINCGGASDDEFITIQVTQMSLTSSNDTIVCPQERVDLASSSSLSGGVFLWEDQAGNIIGQNASVSVYPEDPTMYIVTVTDGCTKRDTVFVDVYPLPNVTASAGAPSVCPGESVTLEALGNAATYLWSSVPFDNTLTGQENLPNPTVTPATDTKYSLTGTSLNGCISSSDIDITIKDKKTAEFNTSAAVACEGEAITFTYGGNASPGATYQWDFDGQVRTGQGPHDITWPAMGTKTITLVVTQDLCASDPITHTIEVKPTPLTNFTYGITEGCVPLTVDFTDASTNTAPGVTYFWDFGAAGTSVKQSPSVEFTTPGKFDISLKVSNPGCDNTYTITNLVDAWPVPVPGFTADPMKVSLKNPNITFISTSTGDNLTYEWHTGDGFIYDTSTFVHTYADSGFYHVKLVTENSFGCIDSISNTIHITPKYMLRVPTAFTPNGDGRNDDFRITGNGVKKFRITIYNNWGSLIFESQSIGLSWDGKINGQPALPGLYVYHTYFMDDNDEESEQTGSFILIR